MTRLVGDLQDNSWAGDQGKKRQSPRRRVLIVVLEVVLVVTGTEGREDMTRLVGDLQATLGGLVLVMEGMTGWASSTNPRGQVEATKGTSTENKYSISVCSLHPNMNCLISTLNMLKQ